LTLGVAKPSSHVENLLKDLSKSLKFRWTKSVSVTIM
jgi:hypothetical protein